MTPKFVNTDMYMDYWNSDLNAILRDGSNTSNKADTFLARVEIRLMAWIDKNTFRNVPWNRMTAYQIEKFQYAILEQAHYMIENGDIAQDSGYDQNRGMVADKPILESITVCQPCIDFLVSGGLFNLKIANRKRWLGLGGGSGFYAFDEIDNTAGAGVINKGEN